MSATIHGSERFAMKKSLGAKTLAYPAPVFIIGTYDAEGKPNIMNVAWGGICSSNPPSIAISVREATYTYGNLVRTQAFTVNVPSVSQVKQADLAGICSGRDTNKFAAAGLTPVRSSLVDAPYAQEFPLVIECSVIHTFDLGLHKQFVGQIMDVKAEESILGQGGLIEVAKLQPFIFAPHDGGYYRVGDFIGQAFSIGKP